MALGGYADKVAWVDLTSGKTEFKPIPEDYKIKYIGARGVGDRFVFDNGPSVDPLSPDNILCFMNGPMTGSEANMSGRMAVVTKSPLTGTIVDSHEADVIHEEVVNPERSLTLTMEAGLPPGCAGLDMMVWCSKAKPQSQPMCIFMMTSSNCSTLQMFGGRAFMIP